MANIKTIKYLTQDELRNLLKVIDNKRDKAIFLPAYRHGLRASEIGLLKLSDVDLTNGRIRIDRLKNSQGGEHLLLPDEIRILKAWLKERDSNIISLFPSSRGTPIHRRTLDYMIKKYGAKAGIPPEKRHMHVFKHSIATHLLDAGSGVRFVQDWIGHKNIQNTVIYAQISNRARDEQAKKLLSSNQIVSV